MKKANLLSKAEMKKVMGGNEVDPGGSPKIEACKGKHDGDECNWTYNGVEQSGKCRSYLAQPLHCSDLN